jgi:hypothetical protein
MALADPKLIFGIIAAAVNLAGFYPYIRDIFRGTTKPHPFTWLIWGLIGSIGFFAQLSAGAGAGAWTTLAGALACLLVAALSFTRGDLRIVALDWWCAAGAMLGLVLWVLTKDPLLAVIFVVLTDALGFVPTFRKAYLRPNEETAFIYVTGAISFVLGMMALETYNITTLLYPLYISLSAATLSVLLLVRRMQLRRA